MSTYSDLANSQSETSNNTVAHIVKNPPTIITTKGVDSSIDKNWGGTSNSNLPGPNSNPYYNYYFSGQDINVTIDGVDNASSQFGNIPIIGLKFQINQPKLAIYGFWSYTYDAIAYGARQITGTMEIATQYPNYMTLLLKEVAKARLARTTPNGANPKFTEDDQNILNFWGNGIGDLYFNDSLGSVANLYQEHPAFDIIITYGQQDSSVSDFGQVVAKDNGNNSLFVDTNERLITNTDNAGHQIKLAACEITNMNTQYNTSGQVIFETYDLMVNDVIIG